MKRIVICADGTWNFRDQMPEKGKTRHPTNVTKVARAIRPRGASGIDQVVFYDEGVGTNKGLDRFTGGAFGRGMEDNIRQLYRNIVYNYQPGDELYLFGFSRGAFTVRSLVGFMNRVGLIDKDGDYYVPELYACYEKNEPPDSPRWKKAFRRINVVSPCPPIRFLGVWDTVGALGAPGFLGQLFNRKKYQYHDVSLGPPIENAFQALAIDERRKAFRPVLWERPAGWPGHVEQVWFPGVHSNVGGGYDPDGLANEALHWMVEKAESLGLEFDPRYLQYFRPCFNALLVDSMSPMYRVMGQYQRPLGEQPGDGEAIHQSAIDRLNLAECDYGPKQLIALKQSGTFRIANTTRISRGEPCSPLGEPLRDSSSNVELNDWFRTETRSATATSEPAGSAPAADYEPPPPMPPMPPAIRPEASRGPMAVPPPRASTRGMDAPLGAELKGESVPQMGTHTGASRAVEPPDDRRYIQAQVNDMTDRDRPVRRVRSLRARAPHEIGIRIGFPDKDWLGAEPTAAAFPSDLLPKDVEQHTLTVALSAPGLLDEPEVATITLPRHGNSTIARFNLIAAPDVGPLDGRIVIAHQNRVLQTARIRAAIVDDMSDGGSEPIRVEPEVVARQQIGDLRGRAPFDAALVLNHSESGVSAIMSMSDDKVARFDVPQTLNGVIRSIDELLTDIVHEPKKYMGDLRSTETVDLLRNLARYGSLIHKRIVGDEGLGKKGLAGDGPIQIISAVADARLPVEFIYARHGPDETAPLCPNAEESLRTGACGLACPTGAREHEVICPLAFWGLRRVIERHRHDSDRAERTRGKNFAVLSEPSDGRSTLDVLRGGLVAGTNKVDKTVEKGLEAICKAFTTGTTVSMSPVPTWLDWETQVQANAPSLLVLIVHTEPTPNASDIPRMEIGAGSWLDLVGLRENHVRRPGAGAPLVLLLGCETGIPDREFANFITELRHCGAAIVVASGAKLHTFHAVPAAKAFIAAIRTAVENGGGTFGEVMRTVRREMLAQGMPMVLALTAYGDADWRLIPHS